MALQLSKVVPYFLAGWIPGGQRYCVLCRHNVWRFMPYRRGSADVPALISVLDVIGSDPDQFECPRCGAHDRERHLLMYLRELRMLHWMEGKSVLHFAPEKRLSRVFEGVGMASYIKCDLYPGQADVRRVDMLNIDFEDESFDMVVANHVLEHVADADKALAELYRVLRPDGFALLQTPYSLKLHKTWEDPGLVDMDARLQAYGQADHVRLFGRDVFVRFTQCGFESVVHNHPDVLGQHDPVKHGVNPAEPLFLFKKPACNRAHVNSSVAEVNHGVSVV